MFMEPCILVILVILMPTRCNFFFLFYLVLDRPYNKCTRTPEISHPKRGLPRYT